MHERDDRKTQHAHTNEELFPGASLTDDEVEFSQAMRAYMTAHNVRFPHWSDVLAVARSLGYEKKEG